MYRPDRSANQREGTRRVGSLAMVASVAVLACGSGGTADSGLSGTTETGVTAETADTATTLDGDLDGYPVGEDCDDTDPEIHPAATEVCDGIDNDCDGATDDEDDDLDPTSALNWYNDRDADTYGDPGAAQIACEMPEGTVADSGDCDDGDPSVHPGATEACNGVSDDCDEEVDEGCPDSPRGVVLMDGSGDVLVGDEGLGGAGGSMALLRDWDGDGRADLASKSLIVTGPIEGMTSVSTAIIDFEGPTPYVDRAGDTDGDGLDAVFFGTNQDDIVYLLEGGTSGLVPVDAATATFHGPGSGQSGEYFSTAGDMNDDGLDDVLFGAPAWGENAHEGTVYGWFGPVTGTLVYDTADVVLTGDGLDWNGQGTNLEGPGDLNGDGYDDVVTGGGAMSSGGYVFVIHGPLTGDVALEYSCPGTVLGSCSVLNGAWDRALSVGPDTDGDGYADLLAGSPYDEVSAQKTGRALLFLGPLTNGMLAADPAAVLEGVALSDYAGSTTLLPGDMNFDGFGDMAVGAFGHATGGLTEAGAAYLFYGPVTGTHKLDAADAIFEGASEGARAGWDLSGGDADGDVYADLIIGVPGETLGDTVDGIAVLVHGGL